MPVYYHMFPKLSIRFVCFFENIFWRCVKNIFLQSLYMKNPFLFCAVENWLTTTRTPMPKIPHRVGRTRMGGLLAVRLEYTPVGHIAELVG